MSMRITTRGMQRMYSSNLRQNYNDLNTTMQKVQTERNFLSFAEDPAQANLAFQTRRTFQRTDDQIDNTNYVIGKLSVAYTALDSIIDGDSDSADLSGLADSLQALNDPTAGGRTVLGTSLLTKADTIVRIMNSRYGEEFVFAGEDGLNVPFAIGENGYLTYRGVSVSPPDEEKPVEPSLKSFVDTEAYEAAKKEYNTQLLAYESNPAGGTAPEKPNLDDYTDMDGYKKAMDAYEAQAAAYEEKYAAWKETSKLHEEMVQEATYLDIGLGMRGKDDGTFDVDPTSVYNSALSGLDILGYGEDEDGNPNNIVDIMIQLGNILKNCDERSGAYANTGDANRASELATKLRSCIYHLQEKHTDISAEVTFLNANVEQLTERKENYNERILDIEQMDAADAIKEMNWAQYCYNAALAIGTDLLSQSLIDYMH